MSHDGVIEPRDQLQARVAERLRAAHGTPVSFSELRAMGIENPALLGYELAAAGLPIEQVHEWRGRALVLDPLAERSGRTERSQEEKAERTPAAGVAAARSSVADEPPRGGGPHRIRQLTLRLGSARWSGRAGAAASLALVVMLAALLAVTLSDHPARQPRLSADHPRHGASHARASSGEQHASRASSLGASQVKHAAPAQPAGQQASVAISPAVAASLEATGHQLLSQGHYAQAIGELRGALQASGGSVARCAQPSSAACLTYAYALYDLGSALRLAGDPHAAVPILSERLQIDNQRAAVEEQLDLARAGVA